MSISKVHVSIALVAMILGLMLAVQYRATRDIQRTATHTRVEDLTKQVTKVQNERDQLFQRVNRLRTELDQATKSSEVPAMQSRLQNDRMLAGLIGVKGPGVEVTLNDSPAPVQPGTDPNLFVLHDEDVLNVLNELKAAGAEAIAINGQRLLATSEVRCVGPTILINKTKRLAPPFVIDAIGDPATLENSLLMRGGVVDNLSQWNIQVAIKKMQEIKIPAYTGGISFEYARPIRQ